MTKFRFMTKYGYLLVLVSCFHLAGCVPFHSEAALSVSWGKNQQIQRNSASNVAHGSAPLPLTDEIYSPATPQPQLPKAVESPPGKKESLEDRALFKREVGKSNLYLVPVLPADPDDSL